MARMGATGSLRLSAAHIGGCSGRLVVRAPDHQAGALLRLRGHRAPRSGPSPTAR